MAYHGADMSKPVEIADMMKLAVFLCSSVANNVRGAAWNVDGSWVAQ